MANIASWDPLGDSVFDMFPALLRPVLRGATESSPRMDIAEGDTAYRMSVELPGVDRDAIQVSIYQNNVTINADIREEKMAGQEDSWLLKERTFGKMTRTVTLPEAIDDTAAEAKHEDGVLYLTLPKKRASEVKRLTIH